MDYIVNEYVKINCIGDEEDGKDYSNRIQLSLSD